MLLGSLVRVAALVGALVLAMAGCGSSGPGSITLPPEAERVPLTSRAVAAIALEHLDGHDVASQGEIYTNPDEGDPQGEIGAELRLKRKGDNPMLSVIVRPVTTESPCPEVVECADLGDGVTLAWQKEVPEEDPGIVTILRRGTDIEVVVGYSGEKITGDPRKQKLMLDVDWLEDLAQDPRLALRTDKAMVEQGAKLKPWRTY